MHIFVFRFLCAVVFTEYKKQLADELDYNLRIFLTEKTFKKPLYSNLDAHFDTLAEYDY